MIDLRVKFLKFFKKIARYLIIKSINDQSEYNIFRVLKKYNFLGGIIYEYKISYFHSRGFCP